MNTEIYLLKKVTKNRWVTGVGSLFIKPFGKARCQVWVPIEEPANPVLAEGWILYPVALNEPERHLTHIFYPGGPSKVVNLRNLVLNCLFFIIRQVLLVFVTFHTIFCPPLAISEGFIFQTVSLCCRSNTRFFTGFEIVEGYCEQGFAFRVESLA